MTLHKLTFMGNPVLREVAALIEHPQDAVLLQLVADMHETMLAEEGVGLAAPQVGISQRLFVFRVPEERTSDDKDDAPWQHQTLINPEITPLSDEMEMGWEGCLSIPGLRGVVPRYKRIGYRGIDEKGKMVEREAAGFHARVVQHELDHLDGVLYLDRMKDMRHLTFESEMHHFMKQEEM
ncbi:MAG: peptide deformylase [Alphaproteobacteria bacterium]|nr:peptide deformylase [Alphaproteobacteria bacterium]